MPAVCFEANAERRRLLSSTGTSGLGREEGYSQLSAPTPARIHDSLYEDGTSRTLGCPEYWQGCPLLPVPLHTSYQAVPIPVDLHEEKKRGQWPISKLFLPTMTGGPSTIHCCTRGVVESVWDRLEPGASPARVKSVIQRRDRVSTMSLLGCWTLGMKSSQSFFSLLATRPAPAATWPVFGCFPYLPDCCESPAAWRGVQTEAGFPSACSCSSACPLPPQ
ncbi:hypothetical protein J3F83DRAFT_121256 [Trichoderma novae-zelandiae]